VADLLAAEISEHVELAGRLGGLAAPLEEVAALLRKAFGSGGHLVTFGNGGSAAQAQHLAAELIGRYRRDRSPMPAIALTADSSVLTCVSNDWCYEEIFARQARALAGPGDVVIAFTTSGRSPSVVRGLAAASEQGASTVLFAGGDGGPAASHAQVTLLVPSSSTARVQEMHLLLLHVLSERLDAWAADGGDQ
jgi:D-sedoheptulose 7-phosphate isomerase